MLNELLARLRQRLANAEMDAAYDEFLARLTAGQVASQALQAGDPMPDFLLPNANGDLVSSTELLANGPLVITFFRGNWCPYCAATLDALQAILPQLVAAGGTLVAMTPETGGRALEMQQKHGLQYQVLVDVDLAIAMAFGIVFQTPPRYAALLRRNGIDLAERTGNPAWFLPIPAAFLVRPNGVIARTWVTVDFTHRAEPTEILAALQALHP